MSVAKETMLRKLMEEYGEDISRYTNSIPRPNHRDMITTVTIGTIDDLKKFKKLVTQIVVDGKFTDENIEQMRQLVAEEVVSKL